MINKSDDITIIYIEDSDDVRFACEQTLTLAGYRVISCCDAEHSFPLIQSLQNIIVLTDVRLPGISGLELLNYINEMDNKIPVILITGHGDVEMAVEAMRNGAFDFIEKPCSSDKLLSIIARAVEKRRLVLENQQLLANLQQENGPYALLVPPNVEKFAGAYLIQFALFQPLTYNRLVLFGAFADFLHADQTFPGQITAAVKGQFVWFDNLVNKVINGFINLFFRCTFRESPCHRKS